MEEKKQSKWWRRVKYLLQFTSSLNKENMDDIVGTVSLLLALYLKKYDTTVLMLYYTW